jgi:UDP-glucuronate decarboxylase
MPSMIVSLELQVQRRPDISKAITELHWSPRVGLREGLIKTIEYFEQMVREQPVQLALNR